MDISPLPDATAGPLSLRRATAADLPAIRALIDAAYTRYLTRMDKHRQQRAKGGSGWAIYE